MNIADSESAINVKISHSTTSKHFCFTSMMNLLKKLALVQNILNMTLVIHICSNFDFIIDH